MTDFSKMSFDEKVNFMAKLTSEEFELQESIRLFNSTFEKKTQEQIKAMFEQKKELENKHEEILMLEKLIQETE